VKLASLGSQTLTATDVSAINQSAATTSHSILVYGTATQFAISTTSTTVAAGTSVSYSVTALDAVGDTAVGYRGTVHFTASDPLAVLPVNYTFTSTDSGVHTFTVIYKTVGNPTLTATDTVTSSIVGQNNSVTVVPAAASKFILTPTSSTSVTAGNQVTYNVTAYDAFGNIATNFAGTVAFTSNDPKAVLPASSTLTSGVGSFTATLETSGSHSITASSSGVTAGSTTFTVTAAAAAYFLVAVPATATVGTAITVTVTAKDQYGNSVTNYSTTLTPSSSDSAAILPASVTMTNGVASFSATLETTGSQTISVLDTSALTGTSAVITVAKAGGGRNN
jgi:hypothetical protein